ncbi:MAG: class I SAM-dependent methyltransferase [Clostridia bacterium]|nr:class I SAM-dependent methyltransferase [Clostridia bacterium]
MNSVNKTLYIPLYGKALVSSKNIILNDKKAEIIWQNAGFKLKGKSKSKWLAYFMAMRSAIFDKWLTNELALNENAVVVHVGCGLDSRVLRVTSNRKAWYDVDFPSVIDERRKYYSETSNYKMLAVDMKTDKWKELISKDSDVIVCIEGVSMYFEKQELIDLMANLNSHFKSVKLLMDCYTEKGARLSKYKNPVNEVGVTTVYGYDNYNELAEKSGINFVKEHNMTPNEYIEQLSRLERIIFKKLFAGKISKSIYKIYEFNKS